MSKFPPSHYACAEHNKKTETNLIDDAMIKRLADQAGLSDFCNDYPQRFKWFALTIEQLARHQQKEEDARICEHGANVSPVEQQRVGAARCAEAIRASGKETK